MRNIMRVLARDFKRLLKAPAAWIVALFLIVLPSFYAWINVYGFWDPYGNTGNLRVCVVNEDAGYDDDLLGHLDLGSQIVSKLEDDTQLGWAFVDRDEAMAELSAGEANAAFVIPAAFSSDIVSIVSGDLDQAQLEYYVNEKVGPVAPKIADAGATTLDTQINSAFISEVSAAVVEALDSESAAVKQAVDSTASTASARVGEAARTIDGVRGTVGELDDACTAATGKSRQARQSLAAGKESIASLSEDLQTASTLVGQANLSLARITLSLGDALDSGSSAVSVAMAQANLAIAGASSQVTAARGDVDAAAAQLQPYVDEQARTIAQLQAVAERLPEGDARQAVLAQIQRLSEVNAEAQSLLDDLKTLAADIDSTAAAVAESSDTLNTATQDALAIGSRYRADVSENAAPAASSAIAQLSATLSDLAANVAAQDALIDSATGTLSQLETVLGQSSTALGQTDDLLADAADDLLSLQADLAALGSSDTLQALLDNRVSSERIASFMLSPTQVETEELYPMNAYGSAMAPLFINLTLWIGVFMLMVIMRIEVDREGLEDLTVAQRYLGRQAFLGLMCIAQAAVCCAGCLALGVEVASVPLFYLTAIVASLSYLAIQYSLSSTFQHVGKGLCLILVFVQIPGATGLYPIEMTTEFFRTMYPVFPFTYGINAIRETVFGFYGNQWAFYIAVLAAFLLAFTAVGAAGRPLFANLNRMFERQIRQTDLVNIERVELPDRRYRVVQLLAVLSGRDEYRRGIEDRGRTFMRRYPHLKRGAAIVVIGVAMVATPILMIAGVDKVVTLTLWLLLLIGVIGFLILIEFLRDNILHQYSLANLSDADIDELYHEGRKKGGRGRVADRRWRKRAGGRSARDAAPEDDSGLEHEPRHAGRHAGGKNDGKNAAGKHANGGQGNREARR